MPARSSRPCNWNSAPQQLIPRLREWAAQDPLNERTCEQFLLILYRSGRKAEACSTGGKYGEHRTKR